MKLRSRNYINVDRECQLCFVGCYDLIGSKVVKKCIKNCMAIVKNVDKKLQYQLIFELGILLNEQMTFDMKIYF